MNVHYTEQLLTVLFIGTAFGLFNPLLYILCCCYSKTLCFSSLHSYFHFCFGLLTDSSHPPAERLRDRAGRVQPWMLHVRPSFEALYALFDANDILPQPSENRRSAKKSQQHSIIRLPPVWLPSLIPPRGAAALANAVPAPAPTAPEDAPAQEAVRSSAVSLANKFAMAKNERFIMNPSEMPGMQMNLKTHRYVRWQPPVSDNNDAPTTHAGTKKARQV